MNIVDNYSEVLFPESKEYVSWFDDLSVRGLQSQFVNWENVILMRICSSLLQRIRNGKSTEKIKDIFMHV